MKTQPEFQFKSPATFQENKKVNKKVNKRVNKNSVRHPKIVWNRVKQFYHVVYLKEKYIILTKYTLKISGCISPSRGSAFFKSQKAAQRPWVSQQVPPHPKVPSWGSVYESRWGRRGHGGAGDPGGPVDWLQGRAGMGGPGLQHQHPRRPGSRVAKGLGPDLPRP